MESWQEVPDDVWPIQIVYNILVKSILREIENIGTLKSVKNVVKIRNYSQQQHFSYGDIKVFDMMWSGLR